MDGKEIVKEIKEEETFLLKLFQLEKIINKYKYHLIAFLVVIVLSFIAYQVNSYLNEQMLIRTNNAYNKLLENPNDVEALKVLKENTHLYNLYLLHSSKNIQTLEKVANGDGIVANIAKYEVASLKGDKNSLENYSMTMGAIYKELALLNVERLYLQENNHKKAEEIASQIQDEKIKKIANGLLHYGIVQ